MIKVQVNTKFTGEPFKRVPATIIPDDDPQHPLQALTDRSGVAVFKDAANARHANACPEGKRRRGADRQRSYLVNLDDWLESFVRPLAQADGLELTAEHWAVIRYLLDYYGQHARQAQVRDMIQHFRGIWGAEKGSNVYLHSKRPVKAPVLY